MDCIAEHFSGHSVRLPQRVLDENGGDIYLHMMSAYSR